MAGDPSRRSWLRGWRLALVLGAGVLLLVEGVLLSWVRDDGPLATLDVEGVGRFNMLLNPDDQVITPIMLRDGVWEPTETRWFVHSLAPGDTVVDVGANVGYYTLLASKLVGPGGRVYAFEPDPTSFALLERNVRLHGATNVVLEPKAVSSQAGTIRLYLADENKGDHRIYQPSDETRPFVDVEAVVLDDYLGDAVADVDFVKIDTQGAEVVILRGMTRVLAEARDLRLALELWPGGLAEFGTPPGELIDLLAGAGFRLFRLDGPVDAAPPEIAPAQLRRLTRDAEETAQTNLLALRRPEHLAALRAASARLQPAPR